MIAAGGGSIVCTSSISAVAATPMEVLYDTTKGACHMFARAIAVEFREQEHPLQRRLSGFVRTPHGLREVAELQRYGVDASDAALAVQQGRICEPEEVAKAALFLASDDASFVNGAHLFVDNGFHCRLRRPTIRRRTRAAPAALFAARARGCPQRQKSRVITMAFAGFATQAQID